MGLIAATISSLAQFVTNPSHENQSVHKWEARRYGRRKVGSKEVEEKNIYLIPGNEFVDKLLA